MAKANHCHIVTFVTYPRFASFLSPSLVKARHICDTGSVTRVTLLWPPFAILAHSRGIGYFAYVGLARRLFLTVRPLINFDREKTCHP